MKQYYDFQKLSTKLNMRHIKHFVKLHSKATSTLKIYTKKYPVNTKFDFPIFDIFY